MSLKIRRITHPASIPDEVKEDPALEREEDPARRIGELRQRFQWMLRYQRFQQLKREQGCKWTWSTRDANGEVQLACEVREKVWKEFEAEETKIKALRKRRAKDRARVERLERKRA
jgi:hypothetical protein